MARRTILPTQSNKKRKRLPPKSDTTTKSKQEQTTRPWMIGNEWWKARSSHGRNPKFKDSNALYEACMEYIQYIHDNPLIEHRTAGTYLGEVIHDKLPKMHAMTLNGLCIFLDITQESWHNQKKRGLDFLRVGQYIEQIIQQQKLSGAAAGMLNPAIIARELGLVDKKDLTSDGEKLPAGGSVVVYLPAKEALEG